MSYPAASPPPKTQSSQPGTELANGPGSGAKAMLSILESEPAPLSDMLGWSDAARLNDGSSASLSAASATESYCCARPRKGSAGASGPVGPSAQLTAPNSMATEKDAARASRVLRLRAEMIATVEAGPA